MLLSHPPLEDNLNKSQFPLHPSTHIDNQPVMITNPLLLSFPSPGNLQHEGQQTARFTQDIDKQNKPFQCYNQHPSPHLSQYSYIFKTNIPLAQSNPQEESLYSILNIERLMEQFEALKAFLDQQNDNRMCPKFIMKCNAIVVSFKQHLRRQLTTPQPFGTLGSGVSSEQSPSESIHMKEIFLQLYKHKNQAIQLRMQNQRWRSYFDQLQSKQSNHSIINSKQIMSFEVQNSQSKDNYQNSEVINTPTSSQIQHIWSRPLNLVQSGIVRQFTAHTNSIISNYVGISATTNSNHQQAVIIDSPPQLIIKTSSKLHSSDSQQHLSQQIIYKLLQTASISTTAKLLTSYKTMFKLAITAVDRYLSRVPCSKQSVHAKLILDSIIKQYSHYSPQYLSDSQFQNYLQNALQLTAIVDQFGQHLHNILNKQYLLNIRGK